MSKARAWSFGLDSKTGFDSFERAELEHFKAWLVSACLQPFKHTIPKDTDALSQTSKFKLVDYHHNHNNSMNLNPNYAANKTEKSATITAGDGDLLLPGRSILLRLLCSGTWNPRSSSSSSSYSSPSAACEAMTWRQTLRGGLSGDVLSPPDGGESGVWVQRRHSRRQRSSAARSPTPLPRVHRTLR